MSDLTYIHNMIFKKHVVILLSLFHSIKSMDTWDQIDLWLHESQRPHILENNASVNPKLFIGDMFQTIIDDSDRNVKAVYTRNNPPPYQEGAFESHYICEFRFKKSSADQQGISYLLHDLLHNFRKSRKNIIVNSRRFF